MVIKVNRALSSIIVLLFVLCYCFSCGNDNKQEETIAKKGYNIPKNDVEVQVLQKAPFEKELVSNGKLIAMKKTNLKFEVEDKLKSLLVKNGQLVNKGQLLAVLIPRKFEEKVTKSKIALKKAYLNLEDKLLGRGYTMNQRDSIPNDIYEILVIKSGYKDAIQGLKEAEYELKSSKLISPFGGKIANLNSKEFDQINKGANFLTLIDDTNFEVEFHVLESEVSSISVGDKVDIIPFALETSYKGKVIMVNPVVKENGTILIKAVVKNDSKLLEGMNVKVLLKKEIPEQWVVPKTAVILRQNQEVLFKVVDGKAYWTYVLTIQENSDSYAVIPHPDKSTASLKTNDTIIITGNLNLAHESDIDIKPIKKN